MEQSELLRTLSRTVASKSQKEFGVWGPCNSQIYCNFTGPEWVWGLVKIQELWRTQVMDRALPATRSTYKHFFLTKIVVYNTVDQILDCQCITESKWNLKYFSIKICVKANILSHVFYHGDLRVKGDVSFMDESLTSDFIFFQRNVDNIVFWYRFIENFIWAFFQSFKVKVYELSFRIIERSHTDNFSMHYSYFLYLFMELSGLWALPSAHFLWSRHESSSFC